MINIKMNPSTFAYICNEATIYPGIVTERDDIKVEFTAQDNDKDIKKLKKYLEEEF